MFLMNTAGKNELYVLLNSGVVNTHATVDQPSNPGLQTHTVGLLTRTGRKVLDTHM